MGVPLIPRLPEADTYVGGHDGWTRMTRYPGNRARTSAMRLLGENLQYTGTGPYH